MGALTLSYYHLKRLCRHRPLIPLLVIIPLIAGLARLVFARSAVTLTAVQVCPIICAALTYVVFYIQGTADGVSGLNDGLRSTPLSNLEVRASRVFAGMLVFGVQMGVLGIMLLIPA